jgi:DNA-binding response OmpR family regulator
MAGDDMNGDATERGCILILEDEALIAMDIEMTLLNAGHEDLQICGNLASALDLLASDPPRAALLDLNLGNGETSIPLAEGLKARGIPFLFLTGYTTGIVPVPDDLADRPRLSKPVDDARLLAAVGELVAHAR